MSSPPDEKMRLFCTNSFFHVEPAKIAELLPDVEIMYHPSSPPGKPVSPSDLESMYESIRSFQPHGIHHQFPCQYRFRDQFFESACPDSLRIITHHGAGYDRVDARSATAKGIYVCNTPRINHISTAEIAFLLILMTLRKIDENRKAMREGLWKIGPNIGSNLFSLTLGIVGLGAIGTEVAKRAVAFNMKVLYFQRTRAAPEEEADLQVEYRSSLDDLLPEVDVLSLHCPLTDETRHLIGRQQFGLMKPSAFLINSSRGAVVDEEALIEALRSEMISGAGIDVFETEPCSLDRLSVLESTGKVVCLPHIGTHAKQTRLLMEMRCLENQRRVLVEGREPINKVES